MTTKYILVATAFIIYCINIVESCINRKLQGKLLISCVTKDNYALVVIIYTWEFTLNYWSIHTTVLFTLIVILLPSHTLQFTLLFILCNTHPDQRSIHRNIEAIMCMVISINITQQAM